MQLNSIVIDEIDRSDSEKIELKNKLKARSDKKTNWAINEIIAMCEIEKKFNIDFNNVNGSWAGAFGIPQFLPSSYLRYAVDGNNDNKIDLFNMEDAIFSVANYLNKKNWGTTVEQQKNAVWSYNNSWDYVDAVLNLSQLIKGNSKK
ncbi:hypothetical protein SDC9_196420 [bioreactor metagenome]|uniref:Transglycosylase SLT domain-containing protein n=1 Tax=bioreactor metagenome TaxID=1076179 RepID=A0A645IBZ3_9ZZZZ